MKDSIMIFTAVPLSVVGGIMALWIRGMPFSISAGVGFIALFGIAVLNGIVLIEHLKHLKEKGMKDMNELIRSKNYYLSLHREINDRAEKRMISFALKRWALKDYVGYAELKKRADAEWTEEV